MSAGIPGSMFVDSRRASSPSGGLIDAVNRSGGAVHGAQGFADALKKAAPAAQDAVAGKGVIIDKTDKLYEQCLELETFLIKNLISSMRNTVQKSGLVDEGFAGRMYEDMLYDEYAKDFTRNANFGLAAQAYLELSGQRGKVIIR